MSRTLARRRKRIPAPLLAICPSIHRPFLPNRHWANFAVPQQSERHTELVWKFPSQPFCKRALTRKNIVNLQINNLI